jgi:hypothetical protein
MRRLFIAPIVLAAAVSSGAQAPTEVWRVTNGVSSIRLRDDAYLSVQRLGGLYVVDLDLMSDFTLPPEDTDVWLLTAAGAAKVPGLTGPTLLGGPGRGSTVGQRSRDYSFKNTDKPVAIAVRLGREFFIVPAPSGN